MTTDLQPDPIVQQFVKRMGGLAYGARHIEWGRIPEFMRPGLARWMLHGAEPGRFLQAILRNDLVGAVRNGDEENADLLRDYVLFLHLSAPHGSWGSEPIYNAWRAAGGIIGRAGERRAAE
jgi:hypothetical protein